MYILNLWNYHHLSNQKQESKYLSLEICRGAASIFVVIGHAIGAINQYFNCDYNIQSSQPVFFFFVLSSFIMLTVHRHDFNSIKKWKPYILKRLIRIFTLYWILLLVFFPLFWLNLFKGTGLEQNFGFIIKSFFLYQQNPTFLPPSWSLSYEMMFYFIFGILLIKFRFGVYIFSIWQMLCFFLYAFGIESTILLTDSCNILFGFGFFAYYYLNKIKFKPVILFMSFGVIGMFLSYIYTDYQIYLIGLASMFLIISLSEVENRYNCVNTTTKKAAYLGTISYSLYISHWFCQSLIVKLLVLTDFSFSLSSALIVIVSADIFFAALLYEIIEKRVSTYLGNRLIYNNVNKIPVINAE